MKSLKCNYSNKSFSTVNFPVVMFIMVHKIVLAFESVYETLKLCHSSESCCTVFSCVLLIMLYKVVTSFDCGWDPEV